MDPYPAEQCGAEGNAIVQTVIASRYHGSFQRAGCRAMEVRPIARIHRLIKTERVVLVAMLTNHVDVHFIKSVHTKYMLDEFARNSIAEPKVEI